MKDDEEKTDEIDDSIRITSMKSEIDTVHLQSFHSRKQSKTHDCLSFLTITESIVFSLDRSISLNVLLFRDSVEQTIRENNHRVAATVNSLSTAVISLLFEQSQNQDASVSNKEE